MMKTHTQILEEGLELDEFCTVHESEPHGQTFVKDPLENTYIVNSKVLKRYCAGFLGHFRKLVGEEGVTRYALAWKQKRFRARYMEGQEYLKFPCFNYGINAMICNVLLYTGDDKYSNSVRVYFDSYDDDIMVDAYYFADSVEEQDEVATSIMKYISENYKDKQFEEKLIIHFQNGKGWELL